MVEGLENLAKMEYPGRFIILGRHAEEETNVAIYGVTGRSPSSQARIFVYDEKHNVLRTDVTDREQLNQGSPALLIYPAMVKTNNFMLVSNGAQTNHMFTLIRDGSKGTHPGRLADIAFNLNDDNLIYDPKEGWIDLTTYEPDAPNNTPRVNGILSLHNNIGNLSILKCIDAKKVMEDKSYEFQPGQGRLIATYTGVNQNPLPSFEGEPQEVGLTGKTQQEIAEEVYVALAPKEKEKDFRVAVACWFTKEEKPYIINRNEFYN